MKENWKLWQRMTVMLAKNMQNAEEVKKIYKLVARESGQADLMLVKNLKYNKK